MNDAEVVTGEITVNVRVRAMISDIADDTLRQDDVMARLRDEAEAMAERQHPDKMAVVAYPLETWVDEHTGPFGIIGMSANVLMCDKD